MPSKTYDSSNEDWIEDLLEKEREKAKGNDWALALYRVSLAALPRMAGWLFRDVVADDLAWSGAASSGDLHLRADLLSMTKVVAEQSVKICTQSASMRIWYDPTEYAPVVHARFKFRKDWEQSGRWVISLKALTPDLQNVGWYLHATQAMPQEGVVRQLLRHLLKEDRTDAKI
jgi:hypothetical protein